MVGLVPAISLRKALCFPKRDHRAKPGDDNRAWPRPRLKFATGAQLAKAHTESIGLSPCDVAGAGGPEIIETQFKRFRRLQWGWKLQARAAARQIAHDAIDE